MKTRVQKWGNSLAVRIPKSFAKEMGWSENAPVEMSLEDGAVVIRPDHDKIWDLGSLLSGVTDDNIRPAWPSEPEAPPGGQEDDADGGS